MSAKILCPAGHRHGVSDELARCWIYEGDEPREVPVTRREFQVATALLRTGGTNKEIGAKLYISEDTVKSHIKKLLARTGAETRTELIVAVFRGRLRLVPEDFAAALYWNRSQAHLVH